MYLSDQRIDRKFSDLDREVAVRGLGSLSACFLHAGGILAGSEISRWENFDSGFGRESEKQNAQNRTFDGPRWERNLGMVI